MLPRGFLYLILFRPLPLQPNSIITQIMEHCNNLPFSLFDPHFIASYPKSHPPHMLEYPRDSRSCCCFESPLTPLWVVEGAANPPVVAVEVGLQPHLAVVVVSARGLRGAMSGPDCSLPGVVPRRACYWKGLFYSSVTIFTVFIPLIGMYTEFHCFS